MTVTTLSLFINVLLGKNSERWNCRCDLNERPVTLLRHVDSKVTIYDGPTCLAYMSVSIFVGGKWKEIRPILKRASVF